MKYFQITTSDLLISKNMLHVIAVKDGGVAALVVVERSGATTSMDVPPSFRGQTQAREYFHRVGQLAADLIHQGLVKGHVWIHVSFGQAYFTSGYGTEYMNLRTGRGTMYPHLLRKAYDFEVGGDIDILSEEELAQIHRDVYPSTPEGQKEAEEVKYRENVMDNIRKLVQQGRYADAQSLVQITRVGESVLREEVENLLRT